MAFSLSACDWVDSTGLPGNATGLADTNVAQLDDGGTILLVEQVPRKAALTGESALLTNWHWEAISDTDAISRCQQNPDYETGSISQSLKTACTNAGDCQIQIEESAQNGLTQFTLRLPRLRQPVALPFRLSTTNGAGSTVQQHQLLCAMAINEAPLAQDDRYTLVRSRTRTVRARDPDNLLINDSDDIDLRNKPLQVVTTPVQAPLFATTFELYSDGGFLYQPTPDAPLAANGSISDSFIYALTDGTHTVTANVTLSLVEENRAPRRTGEIENFILSVEDDGDQLFSADLSQYFEDDDPLSFQLAAGSLPASGNFELSASGVLQGIPALDDIGDYHVTILASDGIGRVSSDFTLTINRFSTPNRDPYADDINNQTVRGTFSFTVAEFFEDPEDDELRFSAEGLPANVNISKSGVISGRANAQNRGRWIIVVTVKDGRGGQASDGFRLTIK